MFGVGGSLRVLQGGLRGGLYDFYKLFEKGSKVSDLGAQKRAAAGSMSWFQRKESPKTLLVVVVGI